MRQRQSVPLSSTTLSAAHVQQAQTSSDPLIKSLLPLIPAPNEESSGYAYSMSAPVNIQQGTVNFSQIFSEKNRLNVYYAVQQEQRNEPSSTDGNSLPAWATKGEAGAS